MTEPTYSPNKHAQKLWYQYFWLWRRSLTHAVWTIIFLCIVFGCSGNRSLRLKLYMVIISFFRITLIVFLSDDFINSSTELHCVTGIDSDKKYKWRHQNGLSRAQKTLLFRFDDTNVVNDRRGRTPSSTGITSCRPTCGSCDSCEKWNDSFSSSCSSCSYQNRKKVNYKLLNIIKPFFSLLSFTKIRVLIPLLGIVQTICETFLVIYDPL